MFRRLLRWGFHVAAALSLGLGVATGGLWVRSYFVADVVRYFVPDAIARRTDLVGLASDSGVLVYERYRYTFDTAAAFRQHLDGEWPLCLSYERTWPGRLGGYGDSFLGRLGFFARSKRFGPYPYAGQVAGSVWASPRPVTGTFAGETLGVTLPHWFVALVLASPSILLTLRLRRRRLRRQRGSCLTCGYDLRASQERCPECGTAIPDDGGKRET